MKIVTAQIMRQLDRRAIDDIGIPGAVLMESAGIGLVRLIGERIFDPAGKRIAVFAGKGNNGGDGFVAARRLADLGADVTVFLFGVRKKLVGDAQINCEAWCALDGELVEVIDIEQMGMIYTSLRSTDLIIDALLGTGLTDEVSGIFAEAVEVINAFDGTVVAADLPTGIDSDTGKVLGRAVKADYTASFGLLKLAHVTYPGLVYCGEVELVDIGIPSSIINSMNIVNELVTPARVARSLPSRPLDSHKGFYGSLLIVAGSAGRTGAALLAATGAHRGGAGLVTVAAPRSIWPIIAAGSPETMTAPLDIDGDSLATAEPGQLIDLLENKNALAIGPGLSVDPRLGGIIGELIASSKIPMVIDADGLNNLVGNLDFLAEAKAPVILTPHPGEMARLVDLSVAEVQQNRVEIAREFAAKHNVVLLLKGVRSVIAHPDGRLFINPTGSPLLSVGGSGDVLTGLIGALLAQGVEAIDAAVSAAFIHGATAEVAAESLGSSGVLAGELAAAIPETFESLRQL